MVDEGKDEKKPQYAKKISDIVAEKGANLKMGECADFEMDGKKMKICKVNADPMGFDIYEEYVPKEE